MRAQAARVLAEGGPGEEAWAGGAAVPELGGWQHGHCPGARRVLFFLASPAPHPPESGS